MVLERYPRIFRIVSRLKTKLVYPCLQRLGLFYDFHSLLNIYVLHHDDAFVLQIGAHDGVSNDPVHPFIEKYRWRGLLLEPQRELFQRLTENYRGFSGIKLLNAALADKREVRKLFKVKAGDRIHTWDDQIATLTPEKGDISGFKKEAIETEEVQCVTFKDLLEDNGIGKIDVLQIDVEGYDYQIIKMVDFRRVKPAVIHYEHRHLTVAERQECAAYLQEHGYVLIAERFDTTAYVESELRRKEKS